MASTAENSRKLIRNAHDQFGHLTDPEIKLFTAAATGEVAEFRSGTGAINHPFYANQWGEERCLRADRIAWLCGISRTENCLTERGIRIRGAKILGLMQFDYGVFDALLAFSHCAFNDTISLNYSKVRQLHCQLTHCKSINADGAQFGGPIFLQRGFRAMRIALSNAQINGNFLLNHGALVNPGGDAIQANGLQISGTFAANSSRIVGKLNLYQARVRGNLDLHGTKLFNPEGDALGGTGAEIGGALFLSGDFRAAGCSQIHRYPKRSA